MWTGMSATHNIQFMVYNDQRICILYKTLRRYINTVLLLLLLLLLLQTWFLFNFTTFLHELSLHRINYHLINNTPYKGNIYRWGQKMRSPCFVAHILKITQSICITNAHLNATFTPTHVAFIFMKFTTPCTTWWQKKSPATSATGLSPSKFTPVENMQPTSVVVWRQVTRVFINKRQILPWMCDAAEQHRQQMFKEISYKIKQYWFLQILWNTFNYGMETVQVTPSRRTLASSP